MAHKIVRAIWLIIIGLSLVGLSCAKKKTSSLGSGNGTKSHMKMERVHVLIDQKMIATTDNPFSLIEPVWWGANIYDSYKDYESSLAKFSRGQRLFFAIQWYAEEVDNGGHDQFYSNSTGIVWADALKGFREIGFSEAEAILGESAKRMGGQPPFDREERNKVLDVKMPKFKDLDDRFYKVEANLDAKMLDYARKHPKEFLFDGVIERPALNKSSD